MTLKKDPIGDLFSRPVPGDPPPPPAPVPQVVVVPGPAAAKGDGWIGKLIFYAIIAAFIFVLGTRYTDWGGKRQDQDHHEQKQDDNKQDDKKQDDKKQGGLIAKAKYVIFLSERKAKDPGEVALFEDAAPWIVEKGAEARWFDDTDPGLSKLKEFAISKGVQIPCVVVRDKTNEPMAAFPWPKDFDALKEALK